MMDIYKGILTPRIEMQVRLKYDDSAFLSARYASYVFYNGGTLGYEEYNATVLDTFMTPSQYDDYVYSDIETSVAVGAAQYALERFFKAKGVTFGAWGPIFSVLSTMKSYADWNACQDVIDADFYAETISVAIYGGTEQSSVLIGWDRHPIATVPTDAENVHAVSY